jgi:phosphotriesterase-related protein
MRERGGASDTGWVGAGEEDDLDRRLAAEEEPFDLRRPHVMTALGPIEPAALGPTLAAERVSSPAPEQAASDEPPDDRHRTLAELEDLYAAGGRALLDPTADDGRDVGALRWLAARAPVHLLAVAGVTDRTAPTEGGPGAVARLAATFTRELTEGIGGTPTRAGAILVGWKEAAARGVALHAAARAHAASGAPLLLRTPRPAAASAALAELRGEGVEPARVTVGGFVGRPDEADLTALVAGGVSLAFDRLAANADWPAAAQATTLRALVAAGYGDRLLLSPGLDRRSSLRAYRGEPGWVWLPERFALTLMEAGLDAPAVRRLLVDNPARALTIRSFGEGTEG